MRQIRLRWIIFVSILASAGGPTYGLSAAWQKRIAKEGMKAEDFSWLFTNDETGQRLAWQSDASRIPASLSKIMLAGAVLHFLPRDFRWQSRLLTERAPTTQTYAGDICFDGGGNPHFLTEQAYLLTEKMQRLGITKITGRLWVDESHFDSDYFSETRMEQRSLRAYDAPVSAASFNWNSVNLYIRPTKPGEKAWLSSTPQTSYIRLRNEVKTSEKKTQLAVERKVGKDFEEFIVSGQIASGEPEKVLYRPVQRAWQWTGSNVKDFLRRGGIEIVGGVERGSCAKFSHELAAVEGFGLDRAVQDMMKFSNNFLTEMLAKSLVWQQKGAPARLQDVTPFIDMYLHKAWQKNKPESYSLSSVSGLSYENRLSVSQIVRVLNYQKRQFASAAEFIASMPIAGIDGTLKNRLEGAKLQLRAKTGLLNNVVGIAGYGQTSQQKHFSFAILYNGKKASEPWRVQKLIDALLLDYIAGKE